MRVHFYIEANPIRAKMVKLEKLRYFFWNSYRFYAFGERDEYTDFIDPPGWYLALGSGPEERQKIYRKLFRKYLEDSLSKGAKYLKRFIGTENWVLEQEERLKRLLRRNGVSINIAEAPS
jgi:hypothetical protein